MTKVIQVDESEASSSQEGVGYEVVLGVSSAGAVIGKREKASERDLALKGLTSRHVTPHYRTQHRPLPPPPPPPRLSTCSSYSFPLCLSPPPSSSLHRATMDDAAVFNEYATDLTTLISSINSKISNDSKTLKGGQSPFHMRSPRAAREHAPKETFGRASRLQSITHPPLPH